MTVYRQMIDKTRERHQLLTVLLELTYNCNLACKFCYNDLSLRGEPLSLEQYRTLLADLAEMQVMHLVLSGGEPTMHPEFFEIGEKAREHGFVTRIKSNGHSLTKEKIARIQERIDPFCIDISLHGAGPATHDRLTGVPGSFRVLLKNIHYMIELGQRIRINTVITSINQHEYDDLLRLSETLGIGFHYTDQVTRRNDGDSSPLKLKSTIPLSTLQSRAAKNDPATESPATDTPTDPRKSGKQPKYLCGAGTNSLVVDPFGRIVPCVEWRSAVGNLHETPIHEVWNRSDLLCGIRSEAATLSHEHIENFRNNPDRSLCIAVEYGK